MKIKLDVYLVRLEPQANLVLSAINRVRAVDDVTAGLDAEVTTDAAWLAVLWVGLAQEGTASLDGVQASPDHADNWA
jgi:hypothetical protein